MDAFTVILVLMILGYTIGIVIDYKTYFPKDDLSYDEMVHY